MFLPSQKEKGRSAWNGGDAFNLKSFIVGQSRWTSMPAVKVFHNYVNFIPSHVNDSIVTSKILWMDFHPWLMIRVGTHWDALQVWKVRPKSSISQNFLFIKILSQIWACVHLIMNQFFSWIQLKWYYSNYY